MSPSPSPAHPLACDADSQCLHAPCFQARLTATADRRKVRRQANACAGHVGNLVQALAAWARASDLTDGQLTVLAIDPADHSPQPASGSVPQPAIGYGFAFSTLPLPQ